MQPAPVFPGHGREGALDAPAHLARAILHRGLVEAEGGDRLSVNAQDALWLGVRLRVAVADQVRLQETEKLGLEDGVPERDAEGELVGVAEALRLP